MYLNKKDRISRNLACSDLHQFNSLTSYKNLEQLCFNFVISTSKLKINNAHVKLARIFCNNLSSVYHTYQTSAFQNHSRQQPTKGLCSGSLPSLSKLQLSEALTLLSWPSSNSSLLPQFFAYSNVQELFFTSKLQKQRWLCTLQVQSIKLVIYIPLF